MGPVYTKMLYTLQLWERASEMARTEEWGGSATLSFTG